MIHVFNMLRLKDYQNVMCEKRPPKDATEKLSFFIRHLLKMKNTPAEKSTPWQCFAIKLKSTCKNSGTFEGKKFHSDTKTSL